MKMAAVATAAGVAYALGWLSRQPQVVAARREASTDALTGLVNRAGLKRHLHKRANHRDPYTLFMLDLNGFKPINDTYGHRAGDLLLRQLGHRLQAQLAGHLVTRLGGDEFVICVDAALDGADIGTLTSRITRAVSQAITVPGAEEPIALSSAIGIAQGLPGADPRSVLHAADAAMYLSKARGLPVQSATVLRLPVQESPNPRVRDTRPVRVAISR